MMMIKRWIILVVILYVSACLSAGSAQEKAAVTRLDPALDEIVSSDAKVEKVAGGFFFLEGPAWVRKGGYLIFSDIPANLIYKWNPADNKTSVFLDRSGFTGTNTTGVGVIDVSGQPEIGSNGITVDKQGRVVYCAQGDRKIVRLEKNGTRTELASRFEGKRLSSPNDIIVKSDGAIYFTDLGAGLRLGGKDPQKELPNGLFLLKDDKLQMLTKVADAVAPNGLALSPDEKHLYVIDSAQRKVLIWDVNTDDTLSNPKVFADMSADKSVGQLDGMKVDQKGNVYSTGPGGVWIISPEGKHLGTVGVPEQPLAGTGISGLPANLAFGDADGKGLYLMARTSVYRIRVKIPGIRP